MYSRNKGFTLVELLIVIAIAAIMVTIALPNMNQWIAARRAASSAEQVANLLRFARSEAVRLNTVVYVCPVRIKADATPDHYCNTAHTGEGLAAFSDTNKNGTYERGSDTGLRTVILNSPQHGKRVAYQADNHDFSAKYTGKNQIWGFLPDGTFGHKAATNDTLNPSTGYVKISFTDAGAASERDKKARSTIVVLDSAGRATVCSGNSDGQTDNKAIMSKLCQYQGNIRQQ